MQKADAAHKNRNGIYNMKYVWPFDILLNLIHVQCNMQFNAVRSNDAVFCCTGRRLIKVWFKRSPRVIDWYVIELCRFWVCQHDKPAGYFPNNCLEFLIPRSEIKRISLGTYLEGTYAYNLQFGKLGIKIQLCWHFELESVFLCTVV